MAVTVTLLGDSEHDLLATLCKMVGDEHGTNLETVKTDQATLLTRFAPGYATLLNTGTTGAGTSQDKTALAPRSHAWEVKYSAAPSTVSLRLEGSLDGTNWYTVDSYATATNTLRWVVDKPVRYVRGYLASWVGTSKTVAVRWLGIQ